MKIERILVTGGAGFLGKHVVGQISRDYPNTQIIVPRSKDVDLRNRNHTLDYFKQIMHRIF